MSQLYSILHEHNIYEDVYKAELRRISRNELLLYPEWSGRYDIGASQYHKEQSANQCVLLASKCTLFLDF